MDRKLITKRVQIFEDQCLFFLAEQKRLKANGDEPLQDFSHLVRCGLAQEIQDRNERWDDEEAYRQRGLDEEG